MSINEISKRIDQGLLEYTRYLYNTTQKRARENLTLRNKFFSSSIQYQKISGGFELGILDRVHFADHLTEGGTRTSDKSKYIWLPNKRVLNVKRNRAIPKSKRPSNLLNKKDIFIFEPEGKTPYLAKVKGRGDNQKILVLYWLIKQTKYKKGSKSSFPFESIVNKFFDDKLLVKYLINFLNKG